MDLKRIVDESRNGVVETYYDNGQLKTRANYKNDELNGLYEIWNENGQLKTRGIYRHTPGLDFRKHNHFPLGSGCVSDV